MAKRILYIEDEKFFASAIEATLKAAGYDVEIAEDGEKGLASVVARPPDLVILDLSLPKMQGLDVLEKIKSDPATKDTHVVVLSNYSDDASMARAKELGSLYFFVKVLAMPDEIVTTVKDIIGLPDHRATVA